MLRALIWDVDGTLAETNLRWSSGASACVVASSAGYPGSYKTGFPISGLTNAAAVPTAQVFHSGTSRLGNHLVTSGGRVLAASAQGDTLREAPARAYQALAEIQFEGMYFRRDIGYRALRPAAKS